MTDTRPPKAARRRRIRNRPPLWDASHNLSTGSAIVNAAAGGGADIRDAGVAWLFRPTRFCALRAELLRVSFLSMLFGEPMPDTDAREAEGIAALAQILGVPVRTEHLAEVAAAWRLMAPHRECVAAVDLDPRSEPASLFRP
jgi:hypothetical protein